METTTMGLYSYIGIVAKNMETTISTICAQELV